MSGAEATAAESTAVTAVKALCMANGTTVALTEAQPLEPVALRLADPRLRHHSCTLLNDRQVQDLESVGIGGVRNI